MKTSLSILIILYSRDIRDGVNLVTLESVLLMFGLMLAPAITFGGLAGKHTYGDYGVIEMLISCCFGGKGIITCYSSRG